MITFPKNYWNPIRLIYIVIVLGCYLFFHNYYRIEYLDDPWTLSWAYSWWSEGEVFDLVFGYLDGDGGTSLFSRTYVYLYGAFCSLFGWTRGGAYLLSIILLFSSFPFWYKILGKLDFDESTSLDFLLILMLFEPYYGVAHKARIDSLGFLLLSLTLYLFVYGKYFFSGILLLVAFENHPMGVTGLFYILAYLFVIREDMKDRPGYYLRGALRFIGGCLIGLGYYGAIHFPYLGNYADLGERSVGHAFLSYFFVNRMSWRHWPELVLILISLGYFLAGRKYRKYPAVLPLAAASLLVSLILHRGNMHYVVYLFPPFIMLILIFFREQKLQKLLLIGFLLFQVPQYGYLYYTQRSYDHKQYLSDMQALAIKGEWDDMFIYGTYNGWFALMDYDYHCYGYFSRAGVRGDDLPDTLIVMENDIYRDEGYEAEFKKLLKNRTALDGAEYDWEIVGEIPVIGSDTTVIKRYWVRNQPQD